MSATFSRTTLPKPEVSVTFDWQDDGEVIAIARDSRDQHWAVVRLTVELTPIEPGLNEGDDLYVHITTRGFKLKSDGTRDQRSSVGSIYLATDLLQEIREHAITRYREMAAGNPGATKYPLIGWTFQQRSTQS